MNVPSIRGGIGGSGDHPGQDGGFCFGNATTGEGIGGSGGNSFFGKGGAGATVFPSSGAVGTRGGGGGGSAGDGVNGVAGGAGLVIIYEYGV